MCWTVESYKMWQKTIREQKKDAAQECEMISENKEILKELQKRKREKVRAQMSGKNVTSVDIMQSGTKTQEEMASKKVLQCGGMEEASDMKLATSSFISQNQVL